MVPAARCVGTAVGTVGAGAQPPAVAQHATPQVAGASDGRWLPLRRGNRLATAQPQQTPYTKEKGASFKVVEPHPSQSQLL